MTRPNGTRWRALSAAMAVSVLAAANLPAQTSTRQRSGAADGPRRFVAIGCLSREAPAGSRAPSFFLTDGRGEQPTVYRLDGDEAALALHVGHTMEAAGPLSAPARGPNGRGAAVMVMKVERLTWISTSCARPQSGGKGPGH